MTATLINTPEDYHAWRAGMEPVVLPGKGKVRINIPCANTVLVRRAMVVANTYNPNHVSDDKMELLRQSILDNGFAFPCVVIWDAEAEQFVIVDGFHRYIITGPDWFDLPYVPVAVLEHDTAKRLAATWQFNKARGNHQVDLDADLIRSLIEQGMSDEEIVTHLGIDFDTVHRYKQVTGIAALFANAIYSMAWEMREVEESAVLNG